MLNSIFLAFLLIFVNKFQQCVGYSHSITSPLFGDSCTICQLRSAWFHTIRLNYCIYFCLDFSEHYFLERTLFTRNTVAPKSYVVGFRYVGDISSMTLGGGVIHSNASVFCFLIFTFFSVLPHSVANKKNKSGFFLSNSIKLCCYILKDIIIIYYHWFRIHGAPAQSAMELTFTITITWMLKFILQTQLISKSILK